MNFTQTCTEIGNYLARREKSYYLTHRSGLSDFYARSDIQARKKEINAKYQRDRRLRLKLPPTPKICEITDTRTNRQFLESREADLAYMDQLPNAMAKGSVEAIDHKDPFEVVYL